MQNNDLEQYIDFLLSTALHKCGNIDDAMDLTQETLLSALAYISKGGVIASVRGWLLTVLNRKYYDMLRRKYKLPTISIGHDFDIMDEMSAIDKIIEIDEAESIRRSIAYLGKAYREVIVRYYMDGQSIKQIAMELGIPEGTVKSRLSVGRDRIKKGIDMMESYEKQSYRPISLHVTNSGSWGINGEPMSLVNGDLIVQNLLYLAYAKPVTVEELSRAIGIPMAYIEPIVRKLVDEELMKRSSGKVYTDFMISTIEDLEKHIPAQKQFVEDNFVLLWRSIQDGLDRVRETDYFLRSSDDQRHALELYFVFNCLDYGIYMTFSETFKAEQHFPDRPNGGKWIAFGNVRYEGFNWHDHMDILRHSYSGERHVYLENFLSAKLIGLHVYDPEGFPMKKYTQCPYYKPSYEAWDSDYLKLLYIIHSKTNPKEIGFNTEILRAIPWLTECKLLCSKNGSPAVNIPVLSKSESQELWNICTETKLVMVADLRDKLVEFLKDRKQTLPSHLTSVPLQKQYINAQSALVFATIRSAIQRGKLYDGGYDQEIQPPCPMILIVDK